MNDMDRLQANLRRIIDAALEDGIGPHVARAIADAMPDASAIEGRVLSAALEAVDSRMTDAVALAAAKAATGAGEAAGRAVAKVIEGQSGQAAQALKAQVDAAQQLEQGLALIAGKVEGLSSDAALADLAGALAAIAEALGAAATLQSGAVSEALGKVSSAIAALDEQRKQEAAQIVSAMDRNTAALEAIALALRAEKVVQYDGEGRVSKVGVS